MIVRNRLIQSLNCHRDATTTTRSASHAPANKLPGILRTMKQANCFIVLPQESSGVEPDDTALVQPFDTFV